LDKFSGCQALQGDLVISGSLGAAALNTVQVIYGSLTIFNATSLSSFSAGSLTTVTKELSLSGLTILSTLNFPLLTTVGAVNFVTLPALSTINLNSGISKMNSLYISDTSLETLDGFDVTTLDTFNVNNNKNLASIDSQLQNVNTALEVSYNSGEVEVTFDKLEWANNITFRDVASISLSKLAAVNASLGFINNTITDIVISSLTEIGGSLSIDSNNDLETIDLSNLTKIGGGFVIANNSALDVISGFDDLETVAGAIIFEGNFTNASLPSLKKVSGGVSIESDGKLNCDSFNALAKKGAIQGDSYVCKGASTSTSIAGSSTSAASSTGSSSASSATATASSSHSSSSKAAAGSVTVGASLLTAVAGVVLALL
jgi:hypothetical protein